jgi:hypothetical protein
MTKNTLCLWYEHECEEAARFYAETFPQSGVVWALAVSCLQLICILVRPLQEHAMRPLRYSINVTLDVCCDHRAMVADEESRALLMAACAFRN